MGPVSARHIAEEDPLLSTMQDSPLTITSIMRFGTTFFGDAEVVTATADGSRRRSYAEVGERAARLANALRDLGITGDQRVATFMWNNAEHLEAYLAIPSMGAVLHTLNIRLFPEQVTYIANHAEDKIIICDNSLVPILGNVLAGMTTVETVLVVGDADYAPLEASGKRIVSYDDALAAASPSFNFPEDIDERSAAAMCYTSGTTGNPKGVVYSHRSCWLHSLAACTANSNGLDMYASTLPIVPMFHANAWGVPYAALMAGANLIMPDRFMAAEPLARLINAEGVTQSAAVPTIWNDMLHWLRAHPDVTLPTLKTVLCGGSAVPRALIEAFDRDYGITFIQGWGMTETSPVAAVARPPRGVTGVAANDYRSMAGRTIFGVESRITGEDGEILPNDGKAVGEVEVRGPWVTGSYYDDEDPAKFRDGWLRTGDVGTLDPMGYIVLTDRAKDVIKSGGEWISSVELEGHLMAHPDVLEAAVVGVPDEKWQERPLAAVVVKPDASVTPEQLVEFLTPLVAKWWLPERWTFIDAVPKTSVGKFDKKVLRKQYADQELTVATV